MLNYGMTKFDSVDEFEPFTNLTREQAAKVFTQFAMNILCKKPNLSLNPNYIDTFDADPSLKSYIALAYQLGLMRGSKNTFRPHDHITK
ncbi:MAG: S-layer homology domain-containing protein [Bacteroidota bacterium]